MEANKDLLNRMWKKASENQLVVFCNGCQIYQKLELVDGKIKEGQDTCPGPSGPGFILKGDSKMMIKKFFKFETKQVNTQGLTVHYLVGEGKTIFPAHAVVIDPDGVQQLIDVTESIYFDFDSFISAVIEKYQG